MKHLLPLSILAVFAALTFSSCKKNYTCNCTSTTSFNDSVVATGTSSTQFKTNKNDARNKCASDSSTNVYNIPVLGMMTQKTINTCSLQ